MAWLLWSPGGAFNPPSHTANAAQPPPPLRNIHNHLTFSPHPMFTSPFNIHTVLTMRSTRFSVHRVNQKVPVRGDRGLREGPTHRTSHPVSATKQPGPTRCGKRTRYTAGLGLPKHTPVSLCVLGGDCLPPGANPLTLPLPLGARRSLGAGSTQLGEGRGGTAGGLQHLGSGSTQIVNINGTSFLYPGPHPHLMFKCEY